MEHRIAILGIILEAPEAAVALNRLLHEYRDFIIGRMGLPCPRYGLSIISVVVDAPDGTINALSGKLGMIPGVRVKTTCSAALASENAGTSAPENA